MSQSQLTETESYQTPSAERIDHDRKGEDMDLSALTLSSHSTPRAVQDNPFNDSTVTSSIARPSPYEGGGNGQQYQDDSYLPSTPGKQPARGGYEQNYDDDDPMSSSPFIPPPSVTGTQKGPVMHQFPDRTYRIQATPLGKAYDPSRSRFAATPKQPESSTKHAYDDSPMSSPEPEAPQLNPELFSPVKPETPGAIRNRRPSGYKSRGTPKPGTSVLTPAKGGAGKRSDWDSDEEQFGYDDDDELGLSPPKTMQFHVPQSRLMKTPGLFHFPFLVYQC